MPTTGKPRRRRNGRTSAHASARHRGHETAPATYVTRQIPVYNLLDEEALALIEDQADWILQEVGIELRDDPTALELFRSAGATVAAERVRFDRGHVRALCAPAPASFWMQGRTPERAVRFGGDAVVFGPAYGPAFVHDLEGGRRYGTLNDFENFVKLTYMSPWLHHGSGTICEPVDVPVDVRHLDMVYAHLRYSDRPFMGSVASPQRAEDAIEMARIVFGSEYLDKNCVIQGNINVNSPFVYDGTMSGSLRAYAAANQGLVISPFILGGAMAPVTQAAALAQAHAEAMVGIALTQLVRPGAPVIYGNFLTTMDLKLGTPTFGTPEAMLCALAVGQLARRLNLPFRCGGHYTSSKIPDAQALQESADSMMPALLAGANFVFQAAGWLEGGLTIGYEKFILDADHCGMMHRFLAGLAVDEASLGRDAFREVGPGENFLGTRHTLDHFRTAATVSESADTGSFEQWRDEGAQDAARRAQSRWKRMLRDYEPPPIDPGVDEALREFVRIRKRDIAGLSV